ncbi:MAG TPA: ATPase [Planctomycetaceae bacterium]|nr:ATPase [Planctomycetaceae bacterium]HIQ21999.1 ATPase [Planctomycetota bacterium]
MDYFCGIDIGASAAKLVIIDQQNRAVAKSVRRSGVDYAATASRCLDEALALAGLKRAEVRASLSTGYGRHNVPWTDGRATEITCHGKGAYFHFRRAITVIDIGAQDCKVIHLDADGRRTAFKMNRKCAAGTGAFLEEIAYRLDLPLAQLNSLAERSTREVTLGSFCTVFAATEILEKIRRGERVEDIVKGAFRSVVQRIVEMDRVDGALVLTGGVVAHNPLLRLLAEEAFGVPALVPSDPQFTGAFGAALLAREHAQSGESSSC